MGDVIMRNLVLYYSNSGNTQKVSEVLARELHAELGEITCASYLRWYGPMAMAADIFRGSAPTIDVLIPSDAHYDLVVVGGPVWAARPAPPIRSFLQSHRHKGRYGLFVTCRGTDPNSPPERAIEEMKRLSGGAAETAIFREADIRSGEYITSAVAFARSLSAPAAAIFSGAAESEMPQ